MTVSQLKHSTDRRFDRLERSTARRFDRIDRTKADKADLKRLGVDLRQEMARLARSS